MEAVSSTGTRPAGVRRLYGGPGTFHFARLLLRLQLRGILSFERIFFCLSVTLTLDCRGYASLAHRISYRSQLGIFGKTDEPASLSELAHS